MPSRFRVLLLAAALLAGIGLYLGVAGRRPPSPTPSVESIQYADIGFRSDQTWQSHWRKHGRAVGAKSADEYLRMAQSLRDRPPGGDVLEEVRADGVGTRFDRRTGTFVAYNGDLSLRTFFRPNDGEAYFRRQLERGEGP
jgi:hypothetical protein